jgi:hypothetical protein
MAQESLTGDEAARARIKAAIKRGIERQNRRRGIDQYRPRIAAAASKRISIAELVAFAHAAFRVAPERERPERWLIGKIGRAFGLRRTQVYGHLKKIDPEQWKEICASADAAAKEALEWAEWRRRKGNEAPREYLRLLLQELGAPQDVRLAESMLLQASQLAERLCSHSGKHR